ncbi:cytochrome P450 [Actinoalloteichus hymeniacidonis]|uniref:Cytochrome P450 n=1 Tax=Actinoalloteichus hymeniacidonis TaxID=340345 RepID=A0AAC9HSB4_9PSEU|nr:cytochrome P450 [Actinoalloteichus hymeniacidonis]AOS64508.1 cytochrome P450 [Actinoalloteichus hymeniacidonis]MBB5907420.1 cytochrome P450 [Actinoalloteichus hymeniacidonis]
MTGDETATDDETATATTCPIGPDAAPGGAAEALPFPFALPTALEPPEEWSQLRDECPVARVRTVVGEDALLLTRYDDVRQILADPRFTRKPVPTEDSANDEPLSVPASIANGEGHLRWRRLLSRSFTVKRMTALQPRITTIAHELIDAMVAQGPTSDLRSALGFPLPVYVICELLGVPAADRERFAHWSDHMLNLTRYTQAEVQTAGRELWAYLTAHVRAKRAEPGDDLLSELTAIADEQDGRLSEAELILSGQALLIAGHETTANMIGKMVAMLLSKRERWEQLLADPSLVKSAVEEVLRFDANLGSSGMHRHISEPVEVGGTTIEAGTTVLALMQAANRDERAFAAADEMDLTRSPNPHLTFGAGPHSCLGQALARIELTTVLGVLLERLPGLELAIPAEELRRREGLLVGGLEEVPVRW